MTLEAKLKKIDWKTTGIISGVALAIFLGYSAIIYLPNQKKKNNLETDAILCNVMDNRKLIIDMNLPLTRNKDLNNNGKYESAIFYKNSDERIVYQEITKTRNGNLVLGETHMYK